MAAFKTERLDIMKIRADIALKSPRQCRATLETLSVIKNPAPFIQNNRAQYQQVNNNAGSDPARVKDLNPTNELLTDGSHHATLDTGATSSASSGDPALATVEA